MLPEYLVGNQRYVIDYPDLKRLYKLYSNYSNAEFLADLPNIIHFACFVAWFKQMAAYNVLGDDGIIHELVHLLVHIYDDDETYLHEIRAKFNKQMIIA